MSLKDLMSKRSGCLGAVTRTINSIRSCMLHAVEETGHTCEGLVHKLLTQKKRFDEVNELVMQHEELDDKVAGVCNEGASKASHGVVSVLDDYKLWTLSGATASCSPSNVTVTGPGITSAGGDSVQAATLTMLSQLHSAITDMKSETIKIAVQNALDEQQIRHKRETAHLYDKIDSMSKEMERLNLLRHTADRPADRAEEQSSHTDELFKDVDYRGASAEWRRSGLCSSTRRSSAFQPRPSFGRGRARGRRPTETLPAVGRTSMDEISWNFMETSAMVKEMMSQSLRQNSTIMSQMQAPKVTLTRYDGSPLEFARFKTTFDELVHCTYDNDRSRLLVLYEQCTGRAREAIAGCMHMEATAGYREARSTLARKFGAPHVVTQCWLDKLLGYPQLDSPTVISNFATDVECCRNSLSTLNSLGELENVRTLQQIVCKMPLHMRNRWRKLNRNPSNQDTSKSELLIELLREAADDAEDPAFSESAISKVKATYATNLGTPKTERAAAVDKSKTASLYTTDPERLSIEEEIEAELHAINRTTCASCRSGQHFTSRCRTYRDMTPVDKLSFVRAKKLCMLCLSDSHLAADCPLPWKCQEKTCGRKHHTSLHSAFESVKHTVAPQVHNVTDQRGEEDGEITCEGSSYASIAAGNLPIVRVTIHYGDHAVTTYALMDPGSTVTLCAQSIVDELAIRTDGSATLTLRTVNGRSKMSCELANFHVSEYSNRICYPLYNAMVVERVKVAIDTLTDLDTIQAYPHLRELRFHRGSEEEIGLLIGQNNAHLLEPLETVKSGSPMDPYAVGTPLGWILYGAVREDFSRGDVPIPPPLGGVQVWNPTGDVNSIGCVASFDVDDDVIDPTDEVCVYAGCACADECLSEALQQMGSLEEVPTLHKELTDEEQLVLNLWEKEMSFENGHIVLPIPFRSEPPDLINNFMAAYRSLIQLGKHLLKNEQERIQYRDAVYADFDNNHAEIVKDTTPALTQKAWYLLHHGVNHPRKPKVTRVVKHGNAEYKGYSLGAATYRCPDLLNSLTEVLTRFRQFKIGATSDIEGMFNQVYTPEHHRDYSRFLFWEDGDPRKRIIVCRMKTHTFGTTWAPAAANFALKKTAQLYAQDRPDIKESINKEFYMDDWMGSQPSVRDTTATLTGVMAAVSKGGFHMQKIASNSREVIHHFPVDLRVKELAKIDIFSEKLPPGVMLGQGWLPETDDFTFLSRLEPKPFTRRGMTSCISSLFDPLGLIAPFILPAKLLLQASCKTSKGWDEELLEGTGEQWSRWIQQLPEIENFRLRRWFGCTQDSRQFLHMFSDGSEKAYGAASYLVVRRGEGCDTLLVTSKSKVAPSKRLTIPKMEMAGAVLAVRLMQMTVRMFGVIISGVYLWVDSTIVLVIIHKRPEDLKTFMGNRVAYIQDKTLVEQWGHVPGKSNPADLVSRGMAMPELNECKLWHEGPEFLREEPGQWRKRQLRTVESVDLSAECKKEKAVFCCDVYSAAQVDLEVNPAECEKIRSELRPRAGFRVPDETESELFNRLTTGKSTWTGNVRLIAIIVRWTKWWSLGVKGEVRETKWRELEVEEIEREELNLIAWSQNIEISKEETTTNAWKQLLPFHEGVWRVGGRFQYAELSTDVKHPLILPRTSNVTELLVREAHVKGGHGATDRTLLELRGRFWVIGGKPTVKKYIIGCILCKRLKARPMEQQMSSLPAERGSPGNPVFWHSGVDLFGPVHVTVKRSTVKRYGAIFTCLNTRAVHLEPVEDLTTSAFLDTLERFTMRRCKPSTLRSDNGTNFVGSDKEVAKAQGMLADKALHTAMTNRRIKWIFNSPSASHQGGVWERLIRSVREILVVLTRDHRVTDARFHTVLTMAEAVMNGRPLTKLTNDVHDLEPLTPGHLIHGCRISPVFQGQYPADRLRQDWQLSQGIACEFWEQWMALYIPTLQRRSKWLNERDNVKIGELVLVVNDQYPRYEWPLGIVREVHPGRDGLVRNVTLRTATGLCRRPIQKIVRLELDVGD